MKNVLYLVLTAAIALCGGCGNKKSPALRTQAALSQGRAEYPMPTAYEITKRINSAGAGFVFGITNLASNAEKYLTSAQKAINIGIYGTDLAYVSTYNIEQETRNYLQALYLLTNSLDINTNFNADLVQKVEANINNKDTVISIVSESFHDTYNFLVNDGRDDISLFVLAGAWIEGMYVAAYLATTSARTDEMLAIIAEQRESLGTLLGLLQDTQNQDLQTLRDELASFESSLTLKEGERFTLDNAIAFREKIEKLRNLVI